MRILGIETSCDETAAAVVDDGVAILSSVVASQLDTHGRYGGVVPELASREHLRAIAPVTREALSLRRHRRRSHSKRCNSRRCWSRSESFCRLFQRPPETISTRLRAGTSAISAGRHRAEGRRSGSMSLTFPGRGISTEIKWGRPLARPLACADALVPLPRCILALAVSSRPARGPAADLGVCPTI